MEAPFRAGREQAVEDENAQDLFPIGALAAAVEPGGKERVQAQRPPKFVAQPTGAPLAGMLESQGVQVYVDGLRAAGFRRAVGGKQGDLAMVAAVLVEDGDGFLRGTALGIVDLAQIEDVALGDLAVGIAATLDDGPGAVLLPTLRRVLRFRNTRDDLPAPEAGEKRLGRHSTAFPAPHQNRPFAFNGLQGQSFRKNPKLPFLQLR